MRMIQNGLLGMLIGLSISYFMVALSISQVDEAIAGHELFNQMMVSGTMGAVIGFAATIFQVEKIPLFYQFTSHFLFVILCVSISGYFAGWYNPSELKSWFVLIGKVDAIYLVTWFFIYMSTKRKINELNELIQNRKQH